MGYCGRRGMKLLVAIEVELTSADLQEIEGQPHDLMLKARGCPRVS
jgi:hypothetical protein